jgi:hypothetical protein
MNKPRIPTKEPIHLFLLKSLIYAGAALVLLAHLASWPVKLAVVGAVLVGLWTSRALATSSLRLHVVLLTVLTFVLSGLGLNYLLASSPAVSHGLGVARTLAVTEGLKFGLMAFGLVVALRALSARWRVFALLEVGVVAAAVVYLFAGHRDFQISRPRFLADWAFSHGYDPLEVLLGVGVATVAAMTFVLLPRQRLRRTIAAVVALLLLGGGIIYLFLHLPGLSAQDLSGLLSPAASDQNDDPNFSDKKDDEEKPQPVAFVTLHDDYRPEDGYYHFRRKACSQIFANRLVEASLPGVNLDVPTDFVTQKEDVPGVRLPDEISSELDATIALLVEQKQPFGLVSPVAMQPEDNPDPKTFKKVYSVTSRVPKAGVDEDLAALPAGDPSWPAPVLRHYLEHPNDPRYRELGDQILKDAKANGMVPDELEDSPLLKAHLFMLWIRKNTVYNLKPGNGEAPDPAAEFLFGNREGYCTHVAHAMTYLLRAQRIPARVACGYAVPEDRRGLGSSMVIQDRDGHAWCELFLQGAGWVAVDGSPERSKSAQPPPPDPSLKNLLRDRLNPAVPPANSRQSPGKDPWHHFSINWWLVALASGNFLLVALIILFAVKIWRRLAPELAAAGDLYRLCYRATLDRLAEVGVVRHFGEPREDFARRMASLVPEFEAFTTGHLREAVAGLDTFDRAQWLALKTRIEARLDKLFSRSRRIIGVLNPVSWLWVK